MTGASLPQLEDLYRRDFSRFLRVATAVLHDEDRALDAVQEGFAAAIRERRRFRGDAPLEAWVWRIVLNAARKSRRQSQHQPLRDETAAEATREATAVREAVALLPERQRLALFLRYYADLDYRSIAAALDIRPGTVAASLNAAHESLRLMLQEVPR